jgi:hypothetical protein
MISMLLQNDGCTLREIAAVTKKAPSTISWHLQRMINAEIVRKVSVGCKCSSYLVSNRELVAKVLSDFLESPIDKAVNDYSDLIDELSL